ncbi:MAG TPA: YIEGIA domain-containing protein [Bacillota bacterium]
MARRADAAVTSWALVSFAVGTLAGVAARAWLLRIDYRQYPSYPHNAIVHLTTGVIAAVVGAVFLPALLDGEYTAVTFLVLVATQFREVRTVERETLKHRETTLLIPRGADYIEGIAGVFEARNYLVMAAAVVASSAAVAGWHLFGSTAAQWLCGLLVGAIILGIVGRWRSGRRVGDVADVRPERLRFDGPSLYVGDIYIMNVGSSEARREVERWGRGYRLIPRDEPSAAKLAHPGQRYAILHDVTAILGTRKDVAMPELTPIIRQDVRTGELGVFVTPAVGDDAAVMAVIRQVPLLEGSRGSDPAAFGVGRQQRGDADSG